MTESLCNEERLITGGGWGSVSQPPFPKDGDVGVGDFFLILPF